MDLKGKIAVVTGAASGIGRHTSIALAREGADVVLADLDREGLAEVRNEIGALGRRALAVPCDVSKLEDIQNLYERSISEMGRVDVLMNNAGVHMTGPLEKTPIDDWKWIVDINLWGVVYGIHVFLPHMLDRGSGHIVNTASIGGLIGTLDVSIPYTMTKFAVVGLSQGMAAYLKGQGIGVTVLCPGLVGTSIAEKERRIPVGDGHDEFRRELDKALGKGLKEGKLPDFFYKPLASRGDPVSLATARVTSPALVGEAVVRAIKENTFLIVIPGELMELVKQLPLDMEGFINLGSQRLAELDKAIEVLSAQMEKEK